MTQPQRVEDILTEGDITHALEILSSPMTALEFTRRMWANEDVSPRWVARVVLAGLVGMGLVKTDKVKAAGREYGKWLYFRKGVNIQQAETEPMTTNILTERNIQILQMYSDGFETIEIAKALAIRPRTVKKHMDAARRALGAASKAQMIARAVALGYVHVIIEVSPIKT